MILFLFNILNELQWTADYNCVTINLQTLMFYVTKATSVCSTVTITRTSAATIQKEQDAVAISGLILVHLSCIQVR